jgi:hypothetical protein
MEVPVSKLRGVLQPDILILSYDFCQRSRCVANIRHVCLDIVS